MLVRHLDGVALLGRAQAHKNPLWVRMNGTGSEEITTKKVSQLKTPLSRLSKRLTIPKLNGVDEKPSTKESTSCRRLFLAAKRTKDPSCRELCRLSLS